MKEIQKKACLLGDFAVGKTSLIRRYVEGRFDEKYLSTIGVTVSRKTLVRDGYLLKLLLWDLAGGEGFTRYHTNYLRGAAGALIVCDLTRRTTLESLKSYRDQLLSANATAQTVFIGNKADLDEQVEIEHGDLKTVAAGFDSPYLITSAKTGDRVERAFELMAHLIENRHE